MYPERLSNNAYLNLVSPFRIFQHTLTEPITVHWHEFYELAFVRSGTGEHVLNGVAHPLRHGVVFLLTPTDFHALHPTDTLELYNVIFSDALLTDELRSLVFGVCKNYHVAFTGENCAFVQSGFETLWREAQDAAPGSALMIKAALEQILITLARQGSGAQAGEHPALHHPAVQKALLYIDHHFREPLSLKTLAEHVHLAPSYLSELFQRTTGMVFSTYLQDVRLRFALSLLQSSAISITEICYTAGFTNQSHFTRAFRKKFGISPRESRRPRSESAHERP